VRSVVSGETFVGGEIVWIGDESGRVGGCGLVNRVTVVEGFGERIDAAERKVVAKATCDVDLKCLV